MTSPSWKGGKLACPVCGSKTIENRFDSVNGVCTNCGFVLHPDGSEKILREIQENDAQESEQAERKKDWSETYRIRNSTEQRVAIALEYLEEICDHLELSAAVRLKTASLYAEIALLGFNDGRQTEEVVGATICLATRQMGEPIAITRVARGIERDVRTIGRLTKRIQSELALEDTTCRPESYIAPLCRSLECRDSTAERACELVQSADKAGLVAGRNPVGIAAAAIYSIERENRTQRQIADIAGISRETIRVRLLEFRQGGVIDV